MPQTVLVVRHPVESVELERRARRQGAGEGADRVLVAPQGVEEMAAEIVEAELAGGLRPIRELLLHAGEGLPVLAGELQLDQLRPRVRGGGGSEDQSEGAEHSRGRRSARGARDGALKHSWGPTTARLAHQGSAISIPFAHSHDPGGRYAPPRP